MIIQSIHLYKDVVPRLVYISTTRFEIYLAIYNVE
jgi:hypothetical protein